MVSTSTAGRCIASTSVTSRKTMKATPPSLVAMWPSPMTFSMVHRLATAFCSTTTTRNVYNQLANLGYTYDQMFKEPYNEKFPDWFWSGKYTTSAIMDSLEGKTLSEIIQENFLNTYSEEFNTLRDIANKYSLANDWTPDFSQKYYVMHLVRDNTVPVSSGRAFLRFLNNYTYEGTSEKPFVKSIVPERTKLQTNFVIPDYHHTIVGGITFYLNLAATLAAHPVLYYDDELNTHYADLVEEATVMGIIHKLEDKGFDVRVSIVAMTSRPSSSTPSRQREEPSSKTPGWNPATKVNILLRAASPLPARLSTTSFTSVP